MNGDLLLGLVLGISLASIAAGAVIAISSRRRRDAPAGHPMSPAVPPEPAAPAVAAGAPDIVFNGTVAAAVIDGGWSRATWVAPTFAAVTGLDPDVFREDPTTFCDLVAVMDRRRLDLLAGDRSASEVMRVRDLGTGELRTLLCLVEPVADDPAQAFGLTLVDLRGVDHRMTELEAEVIALGERFEQQRWLTAELGHDLRSPLNALLGSGQLLSAASLPPRERRAAERMASSGDQLRMIVDGLLDLERLESGSMRLECEPVNAEVRVLEVINSMTPLAARRSVTLRSAAVGRSDATLLGDEASVDRILTNLVANAIKFTPPGGDVTVSAGRKGSMVRVVVLDSGPGIADSDRDRLFDRFERLDADEEAAPGSGIGLALCRRLVDAMGGAIGVDRSPRGGSRFWFELPATDPVPNGTGAGRATPTVLTIEDDPDNQELLSDALDDVELQTFTASSATRGLEMLESLRPAVVIVDAHLPDMSPAAFFAGLRAVVLDSDTKVIVVSGSVDRPDLEPYADIVTAFHPKPVDLAVLVGEIVDLVGSRRRGEPVRGGRSDR
jgi:signal transduction histidine kinase